MSSLQNSGIPGSRPIPDAPLTAAGPLKGGDLTVTKLQDKPRNRPRGRPRARSEVETRGMLISAAVAELQRTGYARAGIGAIARRAGLSTRTIYDLVSSKAELFEWVLADWSERFVIAVDDDVLVGLEPVQALERILTAYGVLTLAPDAIAVTRLVFAKSDRFPEIAAAFQANGVDRISRVIEAWLIRQRDNAVLDFDDAAAMAGMLRAMMIMEPQRAILMGLREPPGPAEIADRAAACARLFLYGCQINGVAS